MMRCTIPINERQRRERCIVVGVLLRVGGVDDQLDHGNTSAVRADPMIQRPVTPNDIVMQRLHRDEGGRVVVGSRTKARKAGETIVRKSAMAQANALSHAMGHWHPVCGPSLWRKEPHKARHSEDWRTSSDGKLISRDTRLRRHEACCNAVNIYGKKDTQIRLFRSFLNQEL